MTHYFKDIKHTEDDYFLFEDKINDKTYRFRSCNNVFSKNSVDYGTKVLIHTIIKHFKSLGMRALDLGCGYGAIGISLSDHFKETLFVMSDITQTAVDLAHHNAHINKTKNVTIIKSDLYEHIEGTFGFIITNPPIKVGKKVLLDLIEGAFERLNTSGQIVLVIKKEHGKDSIKKQLENTFGACEVLQRDKGYYILSSQKQGEML